MSDRAPSTPCWRKPLLGLVLACTPLLAQANLITNGSFDSSAAGWTLLSNCGDSRWVSGSAGSTGGVVRLNECGQSYSDPTAYQTVTGLQVGATYLLQWDLQRDHGGGGGNGTTFGVYLNSQPGNPIYIGEYLDGLWHTVTASFVAAASSATLYFATELDGRTPGVSYTSDVDYYIDNISLVRSGAAVPAPSTLPLVGMALAGLAFSRRRKPE